MQATKRKNGRRRKELRNKLLLGVRLCRWCGLELDEKTLTIDHFIPLSSGGDWDIHNCVPACNKCNQLRCQMSEAILRVRELGHRISAWLKYGDPRIDSRFLTHLRRQEENTLGKLGEAFIDESVLTKTDKSLS